MTERDTHPEVIKAAKDLAWAVVVAVPYIGDRETREPLDKAYIAFCGAITAYEAAQAGREGVRDAPSAEVIEAVARAICADLGDLPDSPGVLIRGREGERPNWEGYETTARAAILSHQKTTGGDPRDEASPNSTSVDPEAVKAARKALDEAECIVDPMEYPESFAMIQSANKRLRATGEIQDARDAANVADEIARVTEDACKHLDAFLNLPPEVLTMLATAHLLKERIDYRLNDYLCEMKEGYDDSITGFNEAWDVVRDIFKETFANATTNTREPASRGEANSKSSATQAPEEGE